MTDRLPDPQPTTSQAEAGASEQAPQSKREAASRILELQKRVKPDPEGWTIRDYRDRDRP